LNTEMAVRYCDTYDPDTKTCTHSEHMAREWKGRIAQAELNWRNLRQSNAQGYVIEAAYNYLVALRKAAVEDGYTF
jgi:hypothetical protein